MRTCFVFVALVLGLLVSGVRAERIATVKANFDVGTLVVVPGTEVDLTYKDVHFKLKTLASILDPPPPVPYNQGGLGDGTATVTPSTGEDRFNHISFDWSSDTAVTGKKHFGGEFHADIDIGAQGYRADYFVESMTLTDVSCSSPGFSFNNRQFLKVSSPVTFKVEPVKSINWTFEISDPDIIGPVAFSNVRFYKTSVEPALADLTAANFASLPTTLLLSEPDFLLAFGGEHMVHVTGISFPDWVIVYYETDWVDPGLTALNGGRPVSIHVDQWISTNVLEAAVPEPAGLGLIGVVFLAIRRRRS